MLKSNYTIALRDETPERNPMYQIKVTIMAVKQPVTDLGISNRNDNDEEEDKTVQERDNQSNALFPYDDASVTNHDVESNHEPQDHKLQKKENEAKKVIKVQNINWVKSITSTSRNYESHYGLKKAVTTLFCLVFGMVIILAFILICVIFCRILISCSECVRNIRFVRYFFNVQINNAREYRTLTKSMLNKYIPKRKLGKDLGKFGNANCAICMCEYDEDCSVREIKLCGHMYHSECLERWLKVKELCPLCKQGLSKHHLDPDKYGPDLRDLDNQLNVIIEEDNIDEEREEVNAINTTNRNLLASFEERRNMQRELQQNMSQFQQNMRQFQRSMHQFATSEMLQNNQDSRVEQIIHQLSPNFDFDDYSRINRNGSLRNMIDDDFNEEAEIELQLLNRARPTLNTNNNLRMGDPLNSINSSNHSDQVGIVANIESLPELRRQRTELAQFGRIMDTMRNRIDSLNDQIMRLTREVDQREQIIQGLTDQPEDAEQVEQLTREIEQRCQEITAIFEAQRYNDDN